MTSSVILGCSRFSARKLRRGGRGADPRGRLRHDAGLALSIRRCRRGGAPAHRPRRRDRRPTHPLRPDQRSSRRDRGTVVVARTRLAAKGDPSRERAQGAPRRGPHNLSRPSPSSSSGSESRSSKGATRRGSPSNVQRRAPRGDRGRAHRAQPRGELPPLRARQAAAGAAAIVVTIVGVMVARQLREVPENTLKLAVGTMLTSFGVFWVGEGSGLQLARERPRDLGADRRLLRRRHSRSQSGRCGRSCSASLSPPARRSLARSVMDKIGQALTAFGRFWWEFLIGENPDAFFGAIVTIGAALLLRHDRAAAITVVPLMRSRCSSAAPYRGRKRRAHARIDLPRPRAESSGAAHPVAPLPRRRPSSRRLEDRARGWSPTESRRSSTRDADPRAAREPLSIPSTITCGAVSSRAKYCDGGAEVSRHREALAPIRARSADGTGDSALRASRPPRARCRRPASLSQIAKRVRYPTQPRA